MASEGILNLDILNENLPNRTLGTRLANTIFIHLLLH